MRDEIYRVADELRAIANHGLHFCVDGYDHERYEQVLAASARLVAALEQGSPEEVMAQYRGRMDYVSPLQGVEAAVFRSGRLLLIRRRDDGLWALPGGLVEVGETLAQAAERELREETGLHGTARELLGIFDARRWGSLMRVHLCGFVFRVESAEDLPPLAPGRYPSGPDQEILEAAFFAPDALPPLSAGHDLRVPMVLRLARGELPAPYFDR